MPIFCQRHKCNSRRICIHKSTVSRWLPGWRDAIKVSWTVSRGNEGPRAGRVRCSCLSMNLVPTIQSFLFFFFDILPKKNPTELMTITVVDENRLKLQSNHRSTRIGRNVRSGKKLAIQKLPGHRLFHSREREREGMRMRNPRGIEDPRRGNEEKAAIWNLTETFVKWLGRRRMIDEDATSLDRAATWKNDGAALPRNPIKPRANQRRDI